MKLSEATVAMKGVLHGDDADFDWVSIDSRTLKSGELFFAIRGDNFDGEAFVERASCAGACAAVVSKHQDDLNFPQIVVDNTTVALGKLANFKRENMQGKVIAITGSCGKTSVKGMLKHILELHGQTNATKTNATKGNQNNQIGVPLTILSSENDVDFLIVEAGTSFKGEIKYLTSIINPDVSVVTNVHPAHLEGFGSIDAIAEEKSDIYSAGERVPSAVVNACLLQYGSFIKKIPSGEIIVFSTDAGSENLRGTKLAAENIELDRHGRAIFDLCLHGEYQSVSLSVLGGHQVENALAAAGCAVSLGIPLHVIKQGLNAYQGEKSRMQIISLPCGTLIDDSYNANPASMQAAIDYLSKQKDSLLVLGDMGELGKDAEIEHKNIGRYAKQLGVRSIYCVGYFAQDYGDGFGEGSQVFRTKNELIQTLIENINKDSTVLVKGSRSAQMDSVCREVQLQQENSNIMSNQSRGDH